MAAVIVALFIVSTAWSQEKKADVSVPITPSSVKIWDVGGHNAFTDLIWFNGEYYCTFREGTGHIPGKKTGEGDGTVRVLASDDARTWKSVALLKKATYDLRDSKISITPDGRLMIVMGGSLYVNQRLMSRQPMVSFSDKTGRNFSDPQPIKIDPGIRSDFDWLWRVTWQGKTGWGVVYQAFHMVDPKKEWGLYLVKTENGIDYQKVTRLPVVQQPNESTIRFASDGSMKILVRRESGSRTAMLGTATAPYTDWQWSDTGESLGGPNMIYLPDGQLFTGGRVKGRTGLGVIDKDGKFHLRYLLPSQGDNSYPGFLCRDNTLFVSYYSSHEGKTAIYLVGFPLDELKKH